jgi:hypothetical protein
MSVTVVPLNRAHNNDTWRETYDSNADFRRAAGITRESVHQATDEPNRVLLTHGDVYVWRLLRRDIGFDRTDAELAVERIIRGVVAFNNQEG